MSSVKRRKQIQKSKILCFHQKLPSITFTEMLLSPCNKIEITMLDFRGGLKGENM